MKLTDTIKRKIGEYWFKLKQRGFSDDAIISKIYSNYGILISIPAMIGVNPMRKISLKAIEGALRSPKTPKHLKAGLLKKYGHLLKGFKGYSALSSTVQANPLHFDWWIVLTYSGEKKLEKRPAGYHHSLDPQQIIDGPFYTKKEALEAFKKRKKNPPYGYGRKHWDDFSTEGSNEDVSDSWDELGRHIPCRDKNPPRRPSEGDIISIPRFGTFMVIRTYTRGIDLQHTGSYKRISLTWRQLRVSKYKIVSKG